MVKPLLLTASTAALLLFSSCDDGCINVDNLERLTQELQPWIEEPEDTILIFSDDNNIQQSVRVSDYMYHEWDTIVEDDCGHTFGSFDEEIRYRATQSGFTFSVSSRGYNYGESDGFRLTFGCNNEKTGNNFTETYDFDMVHVQANVEMLSSHSVGNRNYAEVLEITLPDTIASTDIVKIYYAKYDGLVQFITAGGIVHSIDE